MSRSKHGVPVVPFGSREDALPLSNGIDKQRFRYGSAQFLMLGLDQYKSASIHETSGSGCSRLRVVLFNLCEPILVAYIFENTRIDKALEQLVSINQSHHCSSLYSIQSVLFLCNLSIASIDLLNGLTDFSKSRISLSSRNSDDFLSNARLEKFEIIYSVLL